MRNKILQCCYKLAPFDLRGDLGKTQPRREDIVISCLLITGGKRIDGIDSILFDLSKQDFDKTKFEVVVLNDGGGDANKAVIQKYETALNIVYCENPTAHRVLGFNRNKSIEHSSGKFLLFLDDDTRIFQPDFLSKALDLFDRQKTDVIMVRAHALYGIVKNKYDFLDTYSFSNRCCLYNRSVIEDIGGFNKDALTYEDTEMSIRLNIRGVSVHKSTELDYYHPPLYFDSLEKPFCIGQTIMRMKRRYSLFVWLLAYVNALRFLPYCLVPTQHNLQWFRISLGVLLCPFKKETYYY